MESLDTDSLALALAGRTVLVTGGAGFIGGHLCAALDRAGAVVRVLDDLSTGRRGNLPRSAELVVGDVADERVVRRAVAGCRHVIHLAAMVSVPLSIDDPARCARTNITGTESVLRAAVEGGVESVVHASSAAVYGPEPSVPSGESDAIVCASPYAESKAAGEAAIASYSADRGLRAASLRLFNVFGPRQDSRSAYAAAVAAFVEAAIARRPAVIHGDGRQTRDFVPVGEVVGAFLRATLALADRARAPHIAGGAFNIGLGRETSLLELVRLIGDAAGFHATPRLGPSRPGDVRRSCADLSRSRALLGYAPNASLAESLAELVEWMRVPQP